MVLARLFTDEDFRVRFFADPIGVGKSLGLDESESKRLASLDQTRVDAFAASLYRKRAGDVAKSLPLTRRALGTSYLNLFQRFVNESAAVGREDESASFADYVCRNVGSEPSFASWLGDLARYEVTYRLVSARPSQLLVIKVFRYPVARIASELARGGTIAGVRSQLCLAVWFRFGIGRMLHHHVLTIPAMRRAREL